METVNVDLSDIKADTTFNARKRYEGIEELAQSLKDEGQFTPIIVSPTPGRAKAYKLVAGFRRFAAAKHNGWSALAAHIKRVDDEIEAKWINLLENMARDSLSGYELAMACHDLKTKGVKVPEIQQRLSVNRDYSSSHIYNMIRAIENVHPKILETWAAGAIADNFVFKCAGVKDQAEQLELFAEKTAAPAATATSDSEAKTKSSKPRRATPQQMLDVIESAKEFKNKDVLAIVRWAMNPRTAAGNPKKLKIDGVQYYPRIVADDESEE